MSQNAYTERVTLTFDNSTLYGNVRGNIGPDLPSFKIVSLIIRLSVCIIIMINPSDLDL